MMMSADEAEGVYLDSEEGDVVKLFDEASDLSTIFIVIEPRTSLDLHLRHTPKVRTPGNTPGFGFHAGPLQLVDQRN